MIIWVNGAHGAGKTTTSHLLAPLISDARVFDAESVGRTLMDITPGLPATDNFQHWPPWRPLVVDTARRVLDYVGGVLIVPMTVLVRPYWKEISSGFTRHGIDVSHFVLHADERTLRTRINSDATMGPSTFRHQYVRPYLKSAAAWLHDEATVIETTSVNAVFAAEEIARYFAP